MKKPVRPMFLNLLQIRFPIMAIVSILHRISGVWLFLVMPLALYFLQHASHSGASFDQLRNTFTASLFLKSIVWVSLLALFFHVLAGIRHMVMDCGFAESLVAGRFTARLVIILTAIVAILLGVYLW